jgi:hypothetical protein
MNGSGKLEEAFEELFGIFELYLQKSGREPGSGG